MKTIAFGLASMLVVLGCATAPTPEQEAAQAKADQTIEEILTTPLEEREYAPVRCVSVHAYHTVEILDDQHVLFRGTGDRVWLNKLRHRCIGLRPTSVPIFRLRDSQVCDLDTFEGSDRMFGWFGRTSATCSLGTFARITPEQASAIRDSLREARRRR
jgi:hypothetical protein